MPHGCFALYCGSRPLLGNEPVGRGGDAVELKVRGRGGMPTPQQLAADVAAGAPAVSPTKLRADVAAASAAHAEPAAAEASFPLADAKPLHEPGVGARAPSSDKVVGKPSGARVEKAGEEAAKTGAPVPRLTRPQSHPNPTHCNPTHPSLVHPLQPHLAPPHSTPHADSALAEGISAQFDFDFFRFLMPSNVGTDCRTHRPCYCCAVAPHCFHYAPCPPPSRRSTQPTIAISSCSSSPPH